MTKKTSTASGRDKKKLEVKKERLRKLVTATDDELRQAAGGRGDLTTKCQGEAC
jgi:hypothetical protein